MCKTHVYDISLFLSIMKITLKKEIVIFIVLKPCKWSRCDTSYHLYVKLLLFRHNFRRRKQWGIPICCLKYISGKYSTKFCGQKRLRFLGWWESHYTPKETLDGILHLVHHPLQHFILLARSETFKAVKDKDSDDDHSPFIFSISVFRKQSITWSPVTRHDWEFERTFYLQLSTNPDWLKMSIKHSC